MPRPSQARRINGVCILMAQLAEVLATALEIYFPGSEDAQAKVILCKNMAVGLIDRGAGYPVSTDIEQSVSEREVIP